MCSQLSCFARILVPQKYVNSIEDPVLADVKIGGLAKFAGLDKNIDLSNVKITIPDEF